MFNELPKLLDRDFAIAYYLPMTGFLGVSYFLFWLFGWVTGFANVGQVDLVIGVSFLGLVSWLGAISLMAVNRQLTQLLEGYGKLNPLQLLRGYQVRRFCNLLTSLEKLDDEFRNCIECGTEFEIKSRMVRDRIMLDLAENYPDQEHLILPTSFGNAIRAFEVYPRVMYGLEAIQGWERLQQVIPSEQMKSIDSSKSQVDFWINGFVLSVASLIEYGCLVYWSGVFRFWLIIPIMLVSCLFSYFNMVDAAKGWGELIKASFDFYLGDLAAKLRMPPCENQEEEKALWTKYSQAIVYRYPVDWVKRAQNDQKPSLIGGHKHKK